MQLYAILARNGHIWSNKLGEFGLSGHLPESFGQVGIQASIFREDAIYTHPPPPHWGQEPNAAPTHANEANDIRRVRRCQITYGWILSLATRSQPVSCCHLNHWWPEYSLSLWRLLLYCECKTWVYARTFVGTDCDSQRCRGTLKSLKIHARIHW